MRPLSLSCRLAAAASLLLGASPLQVPEAFVPLEAGARRECELSGSASSCSYALEVPAGHALVLAAEPRSVDVVVRVFSPAGQLVADGENARGEARRFRVALSSVEGGGYRLEVSRRADDGGSGRCAITVAELRPAGADEAARLQAEAAEGHARRLRNEEGEDAWRQAAAAYEEALALWQQAGDRAREALVLLELGTTHFGLNEIIRASGLFEETLALQRSLGNREGEADALIESGRVLARLGQPRPGRERVQQALEIHRALGNRRGEAAALMRLGAADHVLGDRRLALRQQEEARALWRELGDRLGEAQAGRRIGDALAGLGEMDRGLAVLEDALAQHRAVGDVEGEAAAQDSLGDLHLRRGEMDLAQPYLLEALQHFWGTGARRDIVSVLVRLGTTHLRMGELSRALEYYEDALPIARELGDRNLEGTVLTSAGLALVGLGEPGKALDHLRQGLDLQRATGNRAEEGLTLSHMAAAYEDLGDPRRALTRAREALAIQRQRDDRRRQGETLHGLGRLYARLGWYDRALQALEEARRLRGAVSDRRGEAATLAALARVHLKMGQGAPARSHYEQALSRQRSIGDPWGEAMSLSGLGMTSLALGRPEKARAHLEEALRVARQAGLRTVEGEALFHLARAERDLGRLAEARGQAEAGLAIAESLRGATPAGPRRRSDFTLVRDQYDLLIGILVQLHRERPDEGHARRAFEAGERARARDLLDLLRGAHADIREGVEPALRQRERVTGALLAAQADRRAELLSGAHRAEELEALDKALEGLKREREEVEAQIRERSPRYAALTQPEPLSVEQIQRDGLDPDSLLLEYALGEKRSVLFAVTPTSLTVHDLPGRPVVEATARQLLAAWSVGGTAAPETAVLARRLGGMLLGPVADQLGSKRLVVVAEGALQYLPFGALPVPDGSALPEPLLAAHEVTYLPSASVLAVLRRERQARPPASRGVAVLADPVFEPLDARVTGSARAPATAPEAGDSLRRALAGLGLLRLARLPSTRAEAEAIAALAPEAGLYLDFQASRAALLDPALGQYRIVHLATHGLLNGRDPEMSGLVLSMVDEAGRHQDGFIQLADVYGLKLGAELVVLSGGRAAVGRKGEGLLGLTRGFMYAGAPRVVASLWPVPDKATAALVERFYREMLVEGRPPAAALHAAQNHIRAQKRWAAPCYWAGFTLQGEWR